MNAKLVVRALLTLVLMAIFMTNLLLIFMVEIPESMQTISSVIVGASATQLSQTVGYWFDSTEANDSSNGKT
tara:strand:+ start:1096 stop:1311 length:216 start_codon:yes stop_codon:yes gene_type:complete